MLSRLVVATVVSLGIAVPAAAFQCPADMAEVDAALQTASLSAEDRARVEQLRAEGEALHASGEHQASVDALAEAKTILGIN